MKIHKVVTHYHIGVDNMLNRNEESLLLFIFGQILCHQSAVIKSDWILWIV